MTGGRDRMVYATRNLDDAVQRAKFYLRYEPTIEQVNQLKAFFKNRFEQRYIYRANGRIVSMKLVRT